LHIDDRSALANILVSQWNNETFIPRTDFRSAEIQTYDCSWDDLVIYIVHSKSAAIWSCSCSILHV
jgi:hypothetical protein